MADEGEITVDLTTLRSRDQDGYLLRFTDTGPGIGEDALERVFDPFYTTKEKGEGTGLGLSICRKLIEESGGWIRAAGGSVFEIWLPAYASVETDV